MEGLRVPWRLVDDSTVWGQPGAAVTFSRFCVEFDDAGATTEVAWGLINSMSIELPCSSRFAARANPVLNVIAPTPYSYSPYHPSIGTTYSGARMASLRLVRTEKYSWRLQFILDDLLRLLAERKDFRVLGAPGFLDDLVATIAPQLGAWSRAMWGTDIPGLNRQLRGHGAFDEEIAEVIDRWC